MEDELVQLDSIYADPGFLLLARDADGERLGCIGVRTIDDARQPAKVTGEIRRLFVRDAGRGTGVGVTLVARLLEDAESRGFERLVLNTLPSMSEAIGLYGRVGFSASEPYVEEPLDDTLYFARDV
jgi:GNAT superfamily N-acetyltransferase